MDGLSTKNTYLNKELKQGWYPKSLTNKTVLKY